MPEILPIQDGGFSLGTQIVPVNNLLGTHFSHWGIGGLVELPSLQYLYDIPIDSLIASDKLSSGRRKLGMIVYVIENNKFFQLKPRRKDTLSYISISEWNDPATTDAQRMVWLDPSQDREDESFNLIEGSHNPADAWSEVFVKPAFETFSDLNFYATGTYSPAYTGQICSVTDTNKVYLLASGISGLTPQEITSNNGSSSELFTGNFTVSIKDGKTFGQYQNGDFIPASGKSAVDVIKMACFEALDPTVTLTSSSTIPFGSTDVNISLNFSKIINTQGASVAVNKIERKRAADPDTSWNTLTSDLNAVSPLSDSFTQTQYDTSLVNYRYTVTDTANATKTVSLNITPAAYAAPTISSVNVGSATRYKGDTATTYAGTITRNSPLIAITSYKLQKSINSGATWSDVGSSVSVTGNPTPISVSLSETTDGAADTNLKNTDTVQYRISVTDTYQTTNLTASTITFVHKRGIIYKSAGSFALATQALTLNDIDTAPNLSLSDTRGSTINGVTAALGVYVYYVYKSTLGNLTNVTQLPSSEVFGSFSKISNISGTNSNGATVSYIVYVTNSDGAFTNKNLQFI
jgi:hypothetical protein